MAKLEKALTVDDVATILGVGVPTVRKLLREKEIHGRKVGREWRVTNEAIAAFLRQGKGK